MRHNPPPSTSNSAFFALEPLFDGFQRAPTLLRGLGDAGHVVVDERGDVELEHARVFHDDVSRRAIQLVLLQLLVGFDDVRQFVGEIVLTSGETKTIYRQFLNINRYAPLPTQDIK